MEEREDDNGPLLAPDHPLVQLASATKAIRDRWGDECPWCESIMQWDGVFCSECGQVPWMQEILTLQGRLTVIIQSAYRIIDEATGERQVPEP